MIAFGNEWDALLKDEFEKDYYKKLHRFLAHEYHTRTIYPDMYDIFNALKYTSFSDVKAVILGQDLSLIHISGLPDRSAKRTDP